ncbi:SPASM domain-containing protein [Deltaproteobacteria bacterium OttesenSCG-928-K17]|nr:SPASM domain-containing protein [Deltaproteobacteria bacterium OttesenSCG-928-K17]
MTAQTKPGDFPGRITIEPTNRCNLHCTFCPRNLGAMKPGDMEWALFRKIADEAALHIAAQEPAGPFTAAAPNPQDRGVAMVFFFRGESLLHPDLCRMISYAKSKGLGPLQLASNGYGLSEELSADLLESGLDFISFSLDTLDPRLYSQARTGGDLGRSQNNILRFIALARERQKRGLARPEIQVSSVDVAEYRSGQDDFIAFWRQKADRVRIYVEHSADGNLGSISGGPAGETARRPCLKLYSDLVVYWDGRVALCNHDWQNQLELGDLHSSSVAEIWKSKAYNNLRKAHEEGSPPANTACAHCDHWYMYYQPQGFLGRVYTSEREEV